MNKSIPISEFPKELYFWDINAIADPFDKITECQYFLDLASKEIDVQRFRWQISAFLNAAYSFFEISALSAHQSFHDPQTGEAIKDVDAIKTLERFVTVKPNPKNLLRVDTGAIHKETKTAIHKVTDQLYKLRKINTHSYPLSIMATGAGLPEAFHFGHIINEGVPALEFCRSVQSLIQLVKAELEA